MEKLRIPRPPEPTLEGLGELYRAWCRYVPFDNIRKRIDSTSNTIKPLPGANPHDFFSHWLANGTGGTCWAGHGALYALLKHFNFPVQYGISTMLSAHPASFNSPGHGTLLVPLDNETYVIDATMLHGAPLPLREWQSNHSVWGTGYIFLRDTGVLTGNLWVAPGLTVGCLSQMQWKRSIRADMNSAGIIVVLTVSLLIRLAEIILLQVLLKAN